MVNFDSICLQLKKSYERNLPEFLAHRKRLYPDFVFDRQARPLKDEIPVFTFHSVEPIRFQRQLQFLTTNKYRTLSADEFYQAIIGKQRIPEKAIVLTFDDGLGSLWSVGYPLLKKYGFTAVCFIVPGCTIDAKKYFPNLYDHWQGKASLEEVLNRETTSVPFCTWQEIEAMHESGVIDFQSHTMYHNLEFTSSTIVDYIHPSFPTWHHNFHVPMFRVNGLDNIERIAELGTPIYTFKPRMAAERRYFDDENVRKKCIEYVRENNGKAFFRIQNWRKKLNRIVQDYITTYGLNDYHETDRQLEEKIYNDLCKSKHIIEQKLPGKTVQHLCYPNFVGSNLSVKISKNAGYATNFWGILPHRRTNHQGEDSYKVVRLREEYIHRLPGKGRKPLVKIFKELFLMNCPGFFKKLIQCD